MCHARGGRGKVWHVVALLMFFKTPFVPKVKSDEWFEPAEVYISLEKKKRRSNRSIGEAVKSWETPAKLLSRAREDSTTSRQPSALPGFPAGMEGLHQEVTSSPTSSSYLPSPPQGGAPGLPALPLPGAAPCSPGCSQQAHQPRQGHLAPGAGLTVLWPYPCPSLFLS